MTAEQPQARNRNGRWGIMDGVSITHHGRYAATLLLELLLHLELVRFAFSVHTPYPPRCRSGVVVAHIPLARSWVFPPAIDESSSQLHASEMLLTT